MNKLFRKKSINISSLIIFLSVMTLLFEITLYYFLPSQVWSIPVAIICSFSASFFLVDNCLDHLYCFKYAAITCISSFIFGVLIYRTEKNEWISYSVWLTLMIFANWFIPFATSIIFEMLDHGYRFQNYKLFIKRMSILFLSMYIILIIKVFFLEQNHVPLVLICSAIPFGFFLRTFGGKIFIAFRLLIYIIFPAVLTTLQFFFIKNDVRGDDFAFEMSGVLIGTILQILTNSVFNHFTHRSITEEKNIIRLSDQTKNELALEHDTGEEPL